MLCISCWPLVHYSLLIRRVAQLASLAQIKDSLPFFMLCIVYIIHMPHALLSARNLGIDLPPLPPLLHFLPTSHTSSLSPPALPASQLPLTLSDCYLLHEAVYSSPPTPSYFPLFPPCAHMRLVPTKQRLFDYFGKFISRHLSLKVTGKIPKYTGGDIENYRRPAPTTPPSTTTTIFSTVCGRRRHRRSFMDVCIK